MSLKSVVELRKHLARLSRNRNGIVFYRRQPTNDFPADHADKRGLDLWFKNTKAGRGGGPRITRMIANPEVFSATSAAFCKNLNRSFDREVPRSDTNFGLAEINEFKFRVSDSEGPFAIIRADSRAKILRSTFVSFVCFVVQQHSFGCGSAALGSSVVDRCRSSGWGAAA